MSLGGHKVGQMDFDRYIAEIGVTVITGALPSGWWGAYDYRTHRIILRRRLAGSQRRSTLAHELGHAVHRHKGRSPEQEREARIWAVQRLIDPEEFRIATSIYDNVDAVACELAVMPSDILLYMEVNYGASPITTR